MVTELQYENLRAELRKCQKQLATALDVIERKNRVLESLSRQINELYQQLDKSNERSQL